MDGLQELGGQSWIRWLPESTIAMRSPPIGIADQGVLRSPGPVPGGRPRQRRAVGAELRHAVAAVLGDQHIALRVEADAVGYFRSPQPATRFPSSVKTWTRWFAASAT
jgi:hypothetical protein